MLHVSELPRQLSQLPPLAEQSFAPWKSLQGFGVEANWMMPFQGRPKALPVQGTGPELAPGKPEQ